MRIMQFFLFYEKIMRIMQFFHFHPYFSFWFTITRREDPPIPEQPDAQHML